MGINLSIISPVYHGEKTISDLCKRIQTCIAGLKLTFEIILVNDAGPDDSWNKIAELAKQDKTIKGINLSRNFGQHYAITAGLDHAIGEWVVVMDCDLQDRPEEIHKLYEKAQEGFEIVLASRLNRSDSWSKKAFSFLFYKILSWLTGINYDHSIANFGLYHRKVIDAILEMGDSIRYFPTMVAWVGFRRTTVEVQHDSRIHGKTSYNLKKLLHLAMDIVLSFSEKPIRLAIKAGLITSAISFLAAIYTLGRALYGKIEVPGYASLIISIWFFSGLIISITGVVGLYVGKTFQAVKNRPIYIASEKINC